MLYGYVVDIGLNNPLVILVAHAAFLQESYMFLEVLCVAFLDKMRREEIKQL